MRQCPECGDTPTLPADPVNSDNLQQVLEHAEREIERLNNDNQWLASERDERLTNARAEVERVRQGRDVEQTMLRNVLPTLAAKDAEIADIKGQVLVRDEALFVMAAEDARQSEEIERLTRDLRRSLQETWAAENARDEARATIERLKIELAEVVAAMLELAEVKTSDETRPS